MPHFTDAMTLDAALTQTADGWVTQARVARGGNVQVYLGSEMEIADREVVRVYRPEAEVFDRKAFATYARKPIVVGHPQGGVNPDNWKDFAVGEIDRDVVRDGEFVSVPLLIRDARAIDAIRSGTRELSMGYDAFVTLADGVTPTGEPFDAVMSGFTMNHVAIVDKARGGAELRIGDGATARWGASPINDHGKVPEMADPISTRTVMVDGLSVVTTDAGAQALEKLTRQLADAKALADKALSDAKAEAEKALADKAAEAEKVVAAKDAEIAKVTAERDAALAKVLDDAALDKRVAQRAELVTAAKAIAPDVELAGLADAAIRKAVVVAKLGDAMKDKAEAYIDARFEILAEDLKTVDSVADALRSNVTVLGAADAAAKAHAKMVADMQSAHLAKKEA